MNWIIIWSKVIEIYQHLSWSGLLSAVIGLVINIIVIGVFAELLGLNKFCVWLADRIKSLSPGLTWILTYSGNYIIDICHGAISSPFLIPSIIFIKIWTCDWVMSQVWNSNESDLVHEFVPVLILNSAVIIIVIYHLIQGLLSRYVEIDYREAGPSISEEIYSYTLFIIGCIGCIFDYIRLSFCNKTLYDPFILLLTSNFVVILIISIQLLFIFTYRTETAYQYYASLVLPPQPTPKQK